MSNRKSPSLVAVLVLAGLALVAAPPAHAQERTPQRIYNALYEMEKARDELKAEKGDLGGHKERAVEYLDTAIRQTEKALREGKCEVKRLITEEKELGRYPHHAHAFQVLVALKAARVELAEARYIPEREREQAIKDIERAEREVEETVKFLK